MNAFQTKHGPFAVPVPGHWSDKLTHTTVCESADRLRLVRASLDSDWLKAVIKDMDIQIAVRSAAVRRLKKVRQLVNAAMSDCAGGKLKS